MLKFGAMRGLAAEKICICIDEWIDSGRNGIKEAARNRHESRAQEAAFEAATYWKTSRAVLETSTLSSLRLLPQDIWQYSIVGGVLLRQTAPGKPPASPAANVPPKQKNRPAFLLGTTLFRARKLSNEDRQFATPDCHLVELPGDHHSIIQLPYVANLAGALNAALAGTSTGAMAATLKSGAE